MAPHFWRTPKPQQKTASQIFEASEGESQPTKHPNHVSFHTKGQIKPTAICACENFSTKKSIIHINVRHHRSTKRICIHHHSSGSNTIVSPLGTTHELIAKQEATQKETVVLFKCWHHTNQQQHKSESICNPRHWENRHIRTRQHLQRTAPSELLWQKDHESTSQIDSMLIGPAHRTKAPHKCIFRNLIVVFEFY
ncbi:unnamed protein product [Caenorhabditis brenneri]